MIGDPQRIKILFAGAYVWCGALTIDTLEVARWYTARHGLHLHSFGAMHSLFGPQNIGQNGLHTLFVSSKTYPNLQVHTPGLVHMPVPQSGSQIGSQTLVFTIL
ncbi:hypothetical protein ALC56_04829 [Trachymyrmex septentrionalis]|uniref:Uncharacterized protein n=1 Tax=Trachymyrmex septentrionalis TaxID=34720 RepID=A0A151JY13_9HYME|nr:hypothetical protein ALC56_04829 [Trachymyrmex septentrionalis]